MWPMWPTKQKAIVLNQSLTLLYLPLILFQVREWELQFSEKYEFVGKLMKPGEEPTFYSDASSDEEEETTAKSTEEEKKSQ